MIKGSKSIDILLDLHINSIYSVIAAYFHTGKLGHSFIQSDSLV